MIKTIIGYKTKPKMATKLVRSRLNERREWLKKPSMQIALIKIFDKFQQQPQPKQPESESGSKIDDAIKIIEKLANAIKCDLEIIEPCFENNYMIKIRANFNEQTTLDDYNDDNNFEISNFIRHFFMNIKTNGTILEFPWNTMKQIEEEIYSNNQNEDPSQSFTTDLYSFSIGSLLNLSTFVCHLKSDHASYRLKESRKMEIDFDKSNLNFYFSVNYLSYRLEIRFDSIKYLVGDKNYNSGTRFYLELNAAPFLYKLNGKFYERIADFSASFAFSNQRNDTDLLGNALSYQIELFDSDCKPFSTLCTRCKEKNRNFQFYIGLINVINQSDRNSFTMKQSYDYVDQFFSKNFRINYACRVLLSKSYKIIDYLGSDLPKFLLRLQTMSEKQDIEQSLYKLSLRCDNILYDIEQDFKHILEDGNQKSLSDSVNESVHVMIRKAILTPTRLEYCRQMPMLRSRFSNMANLDYAIRFLLKEDNNGVLNSASPDIILFLKKIFGKKLENGFIICDRDYQFLGASPSQMRENGINFYAEDDEKRTALTIISNAGNLSSYSRNPSKLMARLGLIFSQAIIYYDISNMERGKIDDIKSEDGKYCFSDGCSIISDNIGNEIGKNLPNLNGYIPSAFQFRNGGHKGVLVSYPIPKNNILFRASQIKYSAKDPKLGILNYSYPRSVYLCRQLVNILNQLGVGERLFKYFNRDTEIIMKSMLTNDAAMNLLKNYQHIKIPFEKMMDAGFSLIDEPFLRSLLQHVMIFRLQELQTKARMKVFETNGRSAFGVIDETKILNYGELFFQYSILDNDGQPTGETKILEGEIMVTKFPCTSLGDVRKFKAINTENLKHIKDCLVFPSKGKRPHTDEMAGSDLDGDEYAIFWDNELIFSGENHEPLNFESYTRPDSLNIVTQKDMINFYLEFATESNLGRIANCHLMFADFHPKGLLSDECIELAKEYSKSLDFQKNGINAKLENEYKSDNRFIRPDFMTKKEVKHNYYLSKNILGEFFRQCCLIDNIVQNTDRLSPDLQEYVEPEKKLIIPEWIKYKNEAMEAFKEYYNRIVETMETLGVESEAAFLTDLFDKRPEVTTFLSRDLFRHMQEIFDKQLLGKSKRQKIILISAWYAICFEKSTLLQYHYKQRPLLGMPFMLSDKLIELAYYVDLNMSVTFSKKIQSTKDNSILFRYDEFLDQSTRFILNWMENFHKIFFKNKITFDKILVKIGGNEEISLQLFLGRHIKNILDSIAEKNSLKKQDNKENNYQDIFLLIDEFFRHLHYLCNEINTYIIESKFEQILLLPYALYASRFIGHIGSFMNINDYSITNKQQRRKITTKNEFIAETIKHIKRLFKDINLRRERLYYNFHFSILDKRLIQLFNNNSSNNNDKYKWQIFVGGLIDYQPFIKKQQQRNNKNGKKITEFGWNLKKFQINFLELKTKGLKPSISLFQLYLGNPHFYDNIFLKFSFRQINC
ncbi:uncharacterized protein LOC113794713 isoform X2 [Dermatophagoides pteronyssinus]|uniref:uncharacterized protein LOC113794713 isoform X2 n=1 Tax=Dermatophagoides pteronyssinus TaxID=6956 RepID=UPI003F678502